MAGAKLERTRWAGIYRRGTRWVYEWTDAHGKRRRGTTDSREQASALKAKEEDRAQRGEFGEAGPRSRLTLAAYALDLFGADLDRENGAPVRGRYAGRRGAIREATRVDYRGHMERTWLPMIGARPLAKMTTLDLQRALDQLAARDGSDYLTDASIRRMFVPLAALLATAAREGLIAHNPARDVDLPSGRDELRRFDDEHGDDDDPELGQARALTREQVNVILAVVDPRWRTFFELLATTGLRVSEALALRWRDVQLDGDRASVKVRRACVNGSYGPPKSRHGRRDVPLGFELVRALRARRLASEWASDDDLVFPAQNGHSMSSRNLRRRTLAPAVEEAGAAWAGFHAFRHFCASALIAEGRNIVQVSRWLGHGSPAFTLNVYAHLLDDGVGDALSLIGERASNFIAA